MKKYLPILLLIGFLGFAVSANAGIVDWWNNLWQPKEAQVGATVLFPYQGGTGTGTPPTYGKILVGNAGGTYTLTSTSSLGISTSEVYSGTVSTSTAPTVGNLAYWTSAGSWPETLGKVATTALTATLPLSLSQPISVLGGSASALSISVAGDWTGTFDGQQGSYYLDANNLTNFGTPFFTYFSATNTDALSQGSVNKYLGALTATYPVQFSSPTVSLAFGTTTSNTWGGIQTIANASTTNISTTEICFANGQCMTAPSITGSLISFFHHHTDAEFAGYEQLLTYPPTGAESDESCTADADVAGGYCLIEAGGYISTTTDIVLGTIPSGTWDFRKYGYTENTAGLNKLESNVYKRTAAGVETFLFQATSSDFNLTGTGLIDYTVAASGYTFLPTDRLVIKLKAWTDSTAGRLIHVVYGSPARYSRIITPITIADQTAATYFPLSTWYATTSAPQFTNLAGLMNIGTTTGIAYLSSGFLIASTSLGDNMFNRTGTWTGNAGTASALAANPSDCSANQFANAIAANGNLTCAALADADIPDNITASSYLSLADWFATTTIPHITTALGLANASSTLFSSSYASSTAYYGAGLADCDTAATSKLLWDTTTGKFSCGTDQTGAGGVDFTWDTTYGNLAAATSSKLWLQDVLYASSTSIFDGLAKFGNATATQLTLTDLYIGGDQIDELVGDGLAVSSNDLIFDCSDVEGTGLNCSGENLELDATGDWTGTIDGNNFGGGAIGAGDLLYGSAAGTISELAKATDGNILSLVGGLPAWVASSTMILAGDVTGTLGVTVVGDNSHAHDSTTISGIDISADTNLTAGDALTLTDDDIDFDGGASPGGQLGGTWASPTIDDLFILNTGDTGTGSYTFPYASTTMVSMSNGFLSQASSTITGLLTMDYASTTALTTDYLQIDSNTTGVLLDTDGDGALIIKGQSGGSDEDLQINLDDTANTIVFTSNTAVSKLDFSGITNMTLAYASTTMLTASNGFISEASSTVSALLNADTLAVVTSITAPAGFGGRSLSISGTAINADAELYTDVIWSGSYGSSSMATTTGTFLQKLVNNAWTITGVKVWANTGTTTFQFEERDGTNPTAAGTDIGYSVGFKGGAGSGNAASTTLSNNTLDAGDIINLEIIDDAPNGTKSTIIYWAIYGTKDD